jgi:hypothetical protein
MHRDREKSQKGQKPNLETLIVAQFEIYLMDWTFGSRLADSPWDFEF